MKAYELVWALAKYNRPEIVVSADLLLCVLDDYRDTDTGQIEMDQLLSLLDPSSERRKAFAEQREDFANRLISEAASEWHSF